jgi:hypothetical protein
MKHGMNEVNLFLLQCAALRDEVGEQLHVEYYITELCDLHTLHIVRMVRLKKLNI